MTPVERLQAAIEKLETLRTGSRNWRVQLSSEDGPEVVHEFDTDGYGPGFGTLAWTITAEGATNIVTLHRTIDAQLAVLRRTIEAVVAREFAEAKVGLEPFAIQTRVERDTLALADAILGTPALAEEVQDG